MRIVALEVENVKRLSAVAIAPDSGLVVVGGQNAAGKSSVLDAIAYALGGKDLVCAKPLREGETKGYVTVELDGDVASEVPPLIVTRTFTTKGTTALRVTTKDGMKPSSPQALLDRLCSHVAFDPLSFTRLSPRNQAITLRQLTGLDLSDLDATHKNLFDKRTQVNRDAKGTAAQVEAALSYPDAAEQEVSVSQLVGELQARRDTNTKNAAARAEVNQYVEDIDEQEGDIASLQAALKKSQAVIAQLKDVLASLIAEHAKMAAATEKLQDADTDEIETQIASSETVNAQVRSNQARAELTEAHKGQLAASAKLTKDIEAVDAEKQSRLEAAEWPVDGLGFDTDGITFSGLPFDQISSAEQLRIAVGIGLALNPTLRVLLIRDGSLLDDDNLRLLADMAAKADAQVWLERVGIGDECAVVIEDGQVKESTRCNAN